MAGENLLDRHAEEPRNAERERQGRIVATRLDRVDRLPRDLELVGKDRLGTTRARRAALESCSSRPRLARTEDDVRDREGHPEQRIEIVDGQRGHLGEQF